MSNQIYKNSDTRYNLVNGGSAYYQFSAVQSIATASPTILANYALIEDRGLGSSVTYSVDQFTFNEDGLYNFDLTTAFAANAVGDRQHFVVFTKIGSGTITLCKAFQGTSTTSGTSILASSSMIQCNKGDYFIVLAEQTSGGALDVADSTTSVVVSKIL